MQQETRCDGDMAAFVGLDWGDKKHSVCVQAVGSQPAQYLTLEQKPEALGVWVAGLRERFAGSKVAVALEQSKGAVLYALMAYDFLILYPINPKSLAKFREAFRVSGAKDDPTDAELLMELVRCHHQKLRVWIPDDEKTRALRLLTEQRRKLVDDQTALTNQLTSCLKEYFPQALQWLGDVSLPMALEFLARWPSLQAVQKATGSQLRKFFSSFRRRQKAEWMEEQIKQIQTAVALTNDAAVVMVHSLTVQAIVSQLPHVAKAIEKFEDKIQELFDTHPDREIFQSLPGAGPALAPRLLAVLGSQRDRFQSASEAQRFSGIAPVTRRSGNSSSVRRRYACSSFVKQSFHEFAQCSIPHCSWARAYYQQLRTCGKGRHAAIRALAFKWIRIIYRCWMDRQPYDEQQYLTSLRSRKSPLFPMIKQKAA
jgi:transposase